MKNMEEQLKKLRNIAFATDKKESVRGNLLDFMAKNPISVSGNFVRNPDLVRLQYQMHDFTKRIILYKRMTIALIIALLLGGGTSFAAENALPGDVLYPIKVQINEKVQEMASIGARAEAEVQAKIAVRRLEEAEKLASENRLSASTAAELKSEFGKHATRSREQIAEIAKKDGKQAAEVSSDIEVSLSAHEDILNGLMGNGSRHSVEVEDILGDVSDNLQLFSHTRIDEEASISGNGPDVKTAAEGAQKSSENKLAEVKKFIDAKRGTLEASVVANADAHLRTADTLMVEGAVKLNAGAYSDAFSLFTKASREAQTAKMFANIFGGLNLKLGIGEWGDGETNATGTVKQKEDTRENIDSDKNDDSGKVEINATGSVNASDAKLKIQTEEDVNKDSHGGIDSDVEAKTGIRIGL